MALTHASHAVAAVCLAAVAIGVLGLNASSPERVLWPAALLILPMAALLILLDRGGTLVRAVAYLAVGAIGTYFVSSMIFHTAVPGVASDALLPSLLKVALIMVGALQVSGASGLIWTTAGFVAGELAVIAASISQGHSVRFDLTSVLAFALLAVIYALAAIARRTAREAQPNIHRAERDEELSNVRSRLEVRAAALMHDTVLSELAALAAATPGPISQAMRDQIARDIQLIVGEEWLSGGDALPAAGPGPAWAKSELADAVRHATSLGLHVEVTGDPGAVARLSPEASRALGQAVRQCLVNVLKHAQTDSAEVVVYNAGPDVSVMVVDGGRGFDEAETGHDRLGLRTSVKNRMDLVGGRVQVWSAPGRGTSVMIHVPARTGPTSGSAPEQSSKRSATNDDDAPVSAIGGGR